ncbi:MAG: hypothetical protein ACRESK_05040 [Gammaproteobacteria bacterium]
MRQGQRRLTLLSARKVSGSTPRHTGGFATSMDILIAVLFPLTWISPNLVYQGMFEVLAVCLMAEIIVLFTVMVVSKKNTALTREEYYRDWIFVRLLMPGFLVYLHVQGVPWNILLFAALVILTAAFPLRIATHDNWKGRLMTDVFILAMALMVSALIVGMVNFPPVPFVHVPAEGIINDLVVKYHLSPEEILAWGTLYYCPKALLNGRRYLEDQRAR